MNFNNYAIRYELELPRKIGKGIKMAAPANKFDITELLKLIPSPVFDAIIIHTLNVDTSVYQNNKDINDLKDKVAAYYGVQKVDGHWEVKPELSGDARKVAQELIDHFLVFPL